MRNERNPPVRSRSIPILSRAGCARRATCVQDYTVLQFTPFDPVNKRTIAKVRDSHGVVFHVCKGAPQVRRGPSATA